MRTRDAAHVLRWEGIGSLEPGNWADLVVVDRNPLTCPVEDLPATEVRATLLAGEPRARQPRSATDVRLPDVHLAWCDHMIVPGLPGTPPSASCP